jgi:hypothetical protein
MIEVFKTNIQNKTQTEEIKRKIFKQYPSLKINFDLEDIDNVLRVEGNVFDSSEIIKVLINNNFECEIMK